MRHPSIVRAAGFALACAGGLAACGSALRAPSDLVLLRAESGLLAVDAASGRAVIRAAHGVVANGGSALITADRVGDETSVRSWTLSSGAAREVARLAGSFEPRVVSSTGRTVALSPRAPESHPGSATRAGRARTALVVLTDTGGGWSKRAFDLAGNLEPEAFPLDEQTLVLIEYLPALAPDRYRLRELDLTTGSIEPLGARIKQFAPEDMRGTGRTQVPAPDGSALYTVYGRQGPNRTHPKPGVPLDPAPTHAFVHVLNLAEGFAHCVDLPDGFGDGPAAAAISSDGRRMFAVDRHTIAELDARSLSLRTTHIDLGNPAAISAAGGPNGRLYVAAEQDVLVLDNGSRQTAHYRARGAVRSLRLSSDGRRLYVATDRDVEILDASNASLVGHLDISGALEIVGVDARPGA